MESEIALLLIFCFLVSTFAQLEQLRDDLGTYSVVASKKLRPNMDYHVSATVHNLPSPVQIYVAVEGPTDDRNYNRISKTAVLNRCETKILKFEVGEWSSGNYSLTVTGSWYVFGGLAFQNQTSLTYEPKSYSVFIQTDKAIYKPGQLVQFRIIVVNLYLLPSVTGAIDIFVTDASGNRIKQWNRMFTTKGIVSANLLLSDKPVLGDWTIHVEVLGQNFKKSFTVAEYVLPTFSVEINLPPYATFNNSDIVATVKARYTYGKPVKGEVKLTASPDIYNFTYRFFSSFETVMKIDGSVDIPINLVQELKLKQSRYYFYEIPFTAVVQEELTGRKYNATAMLKICKTDIKIKLIKSSKTFKPGLKYSALLKIALPDDTPVIPGNDKIVLTYNYKYVGKLTVLTYSVPRNGLIDLEIFPPHEELTKLEILAEYRNRTYYLCSVDVAQSPSQNFIQATLITQNPQIDQEVEVVVNATEPLTHVVVDVIGRGGIVFAKIFRVPNKMTHHVKFPVSHRLAPRAHVLFYYAREENGEIVADVLNFDVDGVLRTPVKVETNVERTKPGAEVNIEVETKPNAFVGLLGIDQSVLLLKSGNDITEKDVIDEIDSHFPGAEEITRRKKRSDWWAGSLTAEAVFNDSGLVILTNGLVYRRAQMIVYVDSPGRRNDLPSKEVFYDDYSEINSESGSSIRIRKHFPETWIWNETTTNNEGKSVLASHVPDTITSWIISAFAMDSVTGLGIARNPAKVTVFRPFFIKLNLPYSILRGESIALQVIVFNYNNKPVEAKVTLLNENEEFDFTVAGNEISDSSVRSRTKPVMIPAQDGSSVTFLITPRKLGYIDISVSAVSPLAGDAIVRKLLVKPEGVPQYFNKAVLIDLRDVSSKPLSVKVPVEIPSNAIDGSRRITVSAIGDILGPSVNNLEQLLQMPFGCGEQNMVNFVPNIVVTDYLQRANRLTPTIHNKALRHMETGYQRELTYKREDGSFSAFGSKDKSGSTWLTAFVVRSFYQAKSHIDIDDKVIKKALHWLIERQNSNGCFEEPGEVYHKAMQGGAGRGGAMLTAFVLVALLENQAQNIYPQEVKRTEEYILKELRSSDDSYMVSIATYALHLSDNPNKDNAFQKLKSLAKQKGNTVFWTTKEENQQEKKMDLYDLSQSQDVEMTAYALLTYALRADVIGAIPIMKWLISQQNENGGYSSTQDTVVGIQALGKTAARLVSSTMSINVDVTYDDRKKSLNITNENALVLQRLELPSSTQAVNLDARGFGVGIVQVAWSYNLAVPVDKSPFSLKPTLGKSSTDNYLELNVCTNYNEGVTNMAVMEIVLPSGFSADVDAFPEIHRLSKVKQVDAADGDSKVIVYFDRIDKEEMCLVVPAHRNYKVANQKPVPVEVYDYYNLAKSSRAFYQPKEGKLCDICEGEDCRHSCTQNGRAGGIISNSILILILLKVLYLTSK